MIQRIDFHTHILPAIDDGSSSIEESLNMLKILADANVEAVVLTPHFYADRDYPEAFLKARQESFEKLKAAVENEHLPKLFIGAEVAYFDGIRTCDQMKDLVIVGTDCLLIELPFSGWNTRVFDNILRLANRIHITPILAHIDRYRLKRSDLHLLEVFSEAGGIIQGNADFFLARNTEKKALKMFEIGMIQILGSDCHNIRSRAPKIGGAFDIIDQKASSAAIEEANNIAKSILGI